jgi:hypothetical protein
MRWLIQHHTPLPQHDRALRQSKRLLDIVIDQDYRSAAVAQSLEQVFQ